MKHISGMAESLSDLILTDATAFVERRVDEALAEIMKQARLRVMQELRFTIREDHIGDRLVMTLEVNKTDGKK